MCIVVDANVLSAVFRRDSAAHSEYGPVLDWVMKGPGFFVYGGTKYAGELQSYLPVFAELARQRKARAVNHALVDKHEKQVALLIHDTKCDDPHLIAMFRVSGCRLLCSDDKRADRYIKDRHNYLKRQKPPSIYRKKSHCHLLNPRNVVQIKHEVAAG
jgi:hypothetical protein